MVDTDAVRRSYDELAAAYDAQRSRDGPSIDVLERMLEDLESPARILDAGCGGGEPVLSRLTESAEAVGLDVSGEQVSLASDRAPAAACVQGDMMRLPFTDDAFDAIVAYWSLIHVPMDDHRSVVDEFARVLRPDGRVLLCEGTNEWVGSNPDWLDSGVEMQWNIAGAERTREQLRDAGFAITDAWRVAEDVSEEDAGDRLASVDPDEPTDDDALPWTIYAARLET